MANGRFEEIPATTTLEDLEKHNRNWAKTDTEFTNQQSDYNGKIIAEQQARAASDSNLQVQITKEVQDRMTAVTAHISAIVAHAAAAITLNPVTGLTANNLQTAVEQLRTMLTTIIAGPAPSAAEIQAARVGADNVARASLDILIKEIHAKLIAANNQTTPLTRGQNLITASEAGPVAVTVKGNTLANILDQQAANCEDASQWSINASTRATDTDNKAYGDKSLKVTITSGALGTSYKDIRTILSDSKYYLILVDVKNGTADRANVFIQSTGGGSSKTGNLISDTTKFAASYTKVQPADFTGATNIYLHLYVRGTTGQYAFFDGVRIYEIDAATYAKIDVDPEYTGDKLAARYPFNEGVKHTVNPVITKVGKNNFDMALPFLGAVTLVESPTSLLVTSAAGAYYYANQRAYPVAPNTTYTLSYKASNVSGADLPTIGVRKGSDLSATIALKEAVGDVVLSFNSGTETSVYLCLFGSRTTAAVQQKRYENIQLEIGAVATPYEPRNDDYLYALTTLIGIGDVKDVLTVRGTEATALRRMKEITVDGSSTWQFSSDYAGSKSVRINNFNPSALSAGVCVGTDHRGMPIGTMFATGIPGRAIVTSDVGAYSLFLNIEDALTGWGETYTPTVGEMSAYFYGWRMNNGTFGTPYNSSGTKTWTRWDATSNTGAVTTVPTTMAEGYTPYKLSYQLATPVTEVVPVEGSLANHAGANLYEVGEGVIVREKVTPVISGLNNYNINSEEYPLSLLSKRVAKFITVFRNGIVDNTWITTQKNSRGDAKAYVPAAIYTPAEYTVTYLALDKYVITAPVVEGALEYNTSSKMVQDTLVQRTTDAETAITIHDRILAQHTARLLALEA